MLNQRKSTKIVCLFKMNSKVYKWCAVPLCKNTSIATPNKLFVYVPNKKIVRDKWLNLARRDPTGLVTNSPLYFCEDHFDLPNDMENYMEYHLMGSVSQVRMKPGCIPKKFACQPDRRKQKSDTTELPYIHKKRNMIAIEGCEKQLEESSIATVVHSDFEEIASGSSGKSRLMHASSTTESSLEATASSKKEEISFKLKPLDAQDKSKVIPACATGQSLQSAPASSNEEEIFIKIKPLERQDESRHASSTSQFSSDATAYSKEKEIPIKTGPSNTQDATDNWNSTMKLRKLVVKFRSNPPPLKLIPTRKPPPKPPQCLPTPTLVPVSKSALMPVSEPIPVSAPIPAPVFTSVSETVSATKVTNVTNAQNSPSPYRILCCMCQNFSEGFTFVCIQCDYKACKECDDLANHNQHYVLRIPARGYKDEIEAVVTKIDELVDSGTLLAAVNKPRTRKGKKRAQQKRKVTANKKMWVDTTLEPKTKRRPKRNKQNNSAKTEKHNVKKPHQNDETQHTVHVQKSMENAQIPEREIEERIEIKSEIDTDFGNESIFSLNVKQESGLTEEEVFSLHTVKEEVDDPLEACEQYLDATVPLGDHAYALMTAPLPTLQPPIRDYEPTPSTSSLYQPSTYMSDDDEETDSADEVYI